MATGIGSYSKTALTNGSASSEIAMQEGVDAGLVNDGIRQIMADLAKWRDDIGGTLVTSGSANTYTVTTNGSIGSLATGKILVLRFNAANTSASTLNPDSLGAKAIRKYRDGSEAAIAQGDILTGPAYVLVYISTLNSSAGGWLLLNPSLGPQSFDGLAPTTTRGDLIARGASTNQRLAVGAANTILKSDGTDPSWATVAAVLSALVTTRGDVITHNGSNVIRRALGAASTVLQSDGTDAIWGNINDSFWSGTDLSIANGGTGQSTAVAGFDALAPTTTRGDIIYRGASNNARLAKGSANDLLTMGANDPAWASLASVLGNLVTTRGDLLTRDGTSVTRLAKGAQNTILQMGANDPAWATISAALTTLATTRGDLLVTDSSPAVARLPLGASGTVLRSNGADAGWASVSTMLASLLTTRGDLLYVNSSPAATRLPIGSAGTVLSSDGTDVSWGSVVTLSSIQTTTGVSTLDFTGIPSSAKIIIVNYWSVSLSGSDALMIQLGYSDGVETSGYTGYSSYTGSSGGITYGVSGPDSSYFIIGNASGNASFLSTGLAILANLNNNNWTMIGICAQHSATTPFTQTAAGRKTVSGGALDRIRFGASGSDTIDANNAVSIMYLG